MQIVNHLLAVLGFALLTGLLVILVRTGKARQCFTFSAYVAVVVMVGVLIFIFPAGYTPEAYQVKQGIYDSLLFGMAIELSIKAFAAFRGVAQRVRLLLASTVLVSTVIVFLLTPGKAAYTDIARYQPGITTAGIWCLAFVAMLIVWYQIPVPTFTRAIILGYVPYLVIFVVYIDLIGRLGWGVLPQLNVLNAVAYDAAAGYWVYSAWRKD